MGDSFRAAAKGCGVYALCVYTPDYCPRFQISLHPRRSEINLDHLRSNSSVNRYQLDCSVIH